MNCGGTAERSHRKCSFAIGAPPRRRGKSHRRFSVTQNVSGTDEANFNGQTNIPGPQGTCGNPQVVNGQLDQMGATPRLPVTVLAVPRPDQV